MKLFRWLGYGYWLFLGVMALFAWSRLGPGPFLVIVVLFVGSILIGPFARWTFKTRFGEWFVDQVATLIQGVVTWRWMMAFFLTAGLFALEWINPWLALAVLAFIVGRVYGKGGSWL
jgi:hypothetical protein